MPPNLGAVRCPEMSRWRLFPELNLLDSKQGRNTLYAVALKSLLRRPRFWIYVILVPTVLGPAMIFAVQWTEANFPALRGYGGGLIGGMIGGLLGGTFQYVFRKPLRKQIRLQLVTMGIPVCIACGYDLRGQREPRCPECGRPFDAKLMKSKPN